MDDPLRKAYQIIFEGTPAPDMEDWQVASAVLSRFNVPKIGEPLAKACILRIINHTSYPDAKTTTAMVGRAEGLATELWDDLPDEPHMAEFEWKEYQGD